ncbi:SPFH domain-containing protein [Alphaproteobacteria bacterium]|jgi:uncharacterized membrane protein YqiK|nr:SPFH domain-containing protein [Alphaproteobacteria bacterium]|tara:strand:+ start:106 stop:2094 length:1989 start_codon:yes stop_codon:yes gene_type:complete
MNITSGADIIAIIILLALAIAIIVYLLHWLYRRSSKEIAFVRTGMGGERVVISGGAFVLPIIHNITSVGMKTLCIEILRNGNKSFITKNRMRAEMTAEFYVRVAPNIDSVSIAAQTLGNRTLEPDHLKELVSGRFVDALGVVAAKMTLDEIQENRSEYVKAVSKHVEEAIKHTGLELETVSLTSLNQAPVSVFDPSNTFDAEGLTQITEITQSRKKKRNDIEKDTQVSIRNKNLQSIKQELEIERDEEFAKFQQKREIEQQRAIEHTESIKTRSTKERESELAEIASQQDIEIAKINKKDLIEMEKSLQETKLIQEIEKRRKEQNDFRQKTAIEIKQQDIETEKQMLELERDVEFSRLEKQRLVDVKLAEEKATTAKEEARKRYESEEAYIMAEEQIKNAKTAQQKNVDAFKIAAEQETRVLDIEKAKRIEIEEKQKQLDVIEKSKIVLKSKMEEEVARAKAVEAEEKVNTARDVEHAEKQKSLGIIEASKNAEKEKLASMAAKIRYEIEAAGKKALNEAENLRSDASRRSALRLKLAEKIEGIIREWVRPMQNIDSIKVVDVNGLPGFSQGGEGGKGGSANGNTDSSSYDSKKGSLADNVVNSALRYRAQQPFLDSLLKEIGMSPGEASNIRNILGDYDDAKKDKHMRFDDDDPTKGSKKK